MEINPNDPTYKKVVLAGAVFVLAWVAALLVMVAVKMAEWVF